MRTLASTFEARDKAEAASRELQAIGIPRDLIVTKYVAPGGGESGFFVSAKVTPDQFEAATEILKRPAPAAAAAAAAAAPRPSPAPRPAPVAEEPIRAARAEPEARPRPAPSIGGDVGEAPAAPAMSALPFGTKPRRPGDEKAAMGRTLIFFGLALVVAFIIGAWLGQLS